ncbi:14527_t:CDS:2 [Funneliformis caledonium]|uniref:14527_t:CDS:1 n=1 Tax=Funneliformis caledonium TaxID=1117310 RepID=A0A9N9DA48_9GLOM|nr:14527_t:CDS:2 [Funneliformis caledonium]
MEGPRWIWDEMADQWIRNGPIKRCLHGGSVADLFGITKDHTSNYLFDMKFYENGDLHSYIDET